MHKLLTLFALPALALVAAPASAQIQSKDATGTTITTCAKAIGGGVLAPCTVRVGSDGAEKGTAANPDQIALPPNAATEATLAAIKVLLGAAPAQDATLQAIKALLGAAPAQDASVQAVKTALGTPAQDATLQAIKALLGAAPAQDSTLQAIKALLGATPSVDTVVQGPSTDIGSIITAANTAQTLYTLAAGDRGFSLGNQTGGACFFRVGAAATQDFHSSQLAAGEKYESKDSHVGTGILSVICANATTGNAGMYGRKWNR